MSTLSLNGIEYVLPGIRKAYAKHWADDFLNRGVMYFTNADEFRENEDAQRGDKDECKGVSIRKGVKCTLDYVNPIYLWCATMETSRSRILETWQDRDTVLEVTDVKALIDRIVKASNGTSICGLAVGPVTYDKNAGSYRPYYWEEGIFQKTETYNDQKEFRFALTGQNRVVQDEWGMDRLETDPHIVLELGDCRAIAREVEA